MIKGTVILDGRTYRVIKSQSSQGHLVSQMVKKADGTFTWRSLRGHGRAYRPELIRAVIDAAYAEEV